MRTEYKRRSRTRTRTRIIKYQKTQVRVRPFNRGRMWHVGCGMWDVAEKANPNHTENRNTKRTNRQRRLTACGIHYFIVITLPCHNLLVPFKVIVPDIRYYRSQQITRQEYLTST